MANIGKRKLTITIDDEDYTAVVSKAEVVAQKADGKFVTFADAAAGGAREYLLNLTLAQDAATGALWRKVWDSAGTDVDVVVAPYGVPAATSTPTFVGTVTITEPDGTFIGGDADPSLSAVQTIDVSWQFVAKPTLTTT